MNKALTCVFAVFLCCGLAHGTRARLLSSEYGVSSQAPSAGICSLRVEIYGYGCEEHTVTTQNGYILSMQRIPAGLSREATGDKTPVLLQHGLLMDGITWLLNAPDESLAYILADNGFDVWIANTRGTKYSLGHTSLSPDDSDYWQWSWDELVSDELPAIIQYVNDQTGQKPHYVAHSLGTLIALAAFSQNKLMDILRSAVLLSPIAHLSQITSPLARATSEAYIAEDLYKSGIYEFDPKGAAANNLLKVVCKKPGVNCYDLMTAFTGKNCCLNSTNIDVFLDNEPQATATKNLVHIAQMVRGGTIAMYDYGDSDSNMQHYGQSTPPVYNMTSIPNEFPLYLSYGGLDGLSDVNDMQLLIADLRDHDSDKLTVQYQADYAHADFVMAVNANEVIYTPIMAFFKLN